MIAYWGEILKTTGKINISLQKVDTTMECFVTLEKIVQPKRNIDSFNLYKSEGYGIFVKKDFYPGDVLLEYKGKLITRLETEKAHEEYHSKNERCFIFDVDWKNSKMRYYIDATYSTCLGRYINDAPKRFSDCRPKTHIINDNPHLLFFSKVFIPNGTELQYDYRDCKNQN
ncbi:N-lysine methyltransferase KMT5A-like [Hydra vulgaris]|uniref:N-lysine methyltransferase KMT5A-like n=1 Tax=Hydra vulgaris TaxID=6087 RepID=UPI0032E9FF13